MFEVLLEVLFELFVGGLAEAAKKAKIPKWLRFLFASVICLPIVGGLVFLGLLARPTGIGYALLVWSFGGVFLWGWVSWCRQIAKAGKPPAPQTDEAFAKSQKRIRIGSAVCLSLAILFVLLGMPRANFREPADLTDNGVAAFFFLLAMIALAVWSTLRRKRKKTDDPPTDLPPAQFDGTSALFSDDTAALLPDDLSAPPPALQFDDPIDLPPCDPPAPQFDGEGGEMRDE